MRAMEEAVADLDSSATPCIAKVAKKHGLSRSTLSRRWRGVTTPRGQSVEDRNHLNQALNHLNLSITDTITKQSINHYRLIAIDCL